jgi:hypothetical protein
MSLVEDLASLMMLGAVLDELRERVGGYTLIDHWKQGEFHHDVVLQLPGGDVIVVATNCNGGVKEVLAFGELPTRSALWHWRCPTSSEFEGALPHLRARAETSHYFDPCELLTPSARSELREEFRERQVGGGWQACGLPRASTTAAASAAPSAPRP